MTDKPAANSALAKQLADAAAIKHAMIEQLIELETKATGHKPEKPGVWRHHTVEWAEQNPPQDLT